MKATIAFASLIFVACGPDSNPDLLTDDTAVIARVDPNARHQRFRGWGMSLAWEANTLAPLSPAMREQFMDLLYGDPADHTTLGLTIARYNIGGGENPA